MWTATYYSNIFHQKKDGQFRRHILYEFYYFCCRHEYEYSDIQKLARKVCLSMDVFCYPPYLFRKEQNSNFEK